MIVWCTPWWRSAWGLTVGPRHPGPRHLPWRLQSCEAAWELTVGSSISAAPAWRRHAWALIWCLDCRHAGLYLQLRRLNNQNSVQPLFMWVIRCGFRGVKLCCYEVLFVECPVIHNAVGGLLQVSMYRWECFWLSRASRGLVAVHCIVGRQCYIYTYSRGFLRSSRALALLSPGGHRYGGARHIYTYGLLALILSTCSRWCTAFVGLFLWAGWLLFRMLLHFVQYWHIVDRLHDPHGV